MKRFLFIGQWTGLFVIIFGLVPAPAFADTQTPAPIAPQVIAEPQIPNQAGPGIAIGNPPSDADGMAMPNAGGVGPSHSPSGAMADIHDIKPVIPPQQLPTTAIWIAVAALVLILLLLLGRYLWRRRKGAPKIPTLTPELPPEENARLALNALAAERLVDGRRFYFRLSEILRRYLFERYAIGAPEMTPEELHPLVARLDLPAGQRGVLNRFWSHSEPVKFAGRSALEADMAADLELMRGFVETTTMAPNGPRDGETPAQVDGGPQSIQRGG